MIAESCESCKEVVFARSGPGVSQCSSANCTKCIFFHLNFILVAYFSTEIQYVYQIQSSKTRC
jgi:hypothetical protein